MTMQWSRIRQGLQFYSFQTAPDKSMFFHAQEYCWEQGNRTEWKKVKSILAKSY